VTTAKVDEVLAGAVTVPMAPFVVMLFRVLVGLTPGSADEAGLTKMGLTRGEAEGSALEPGTTGITAGVEAAGRTGLTRLLLGIGLAIALAEPSASVTGQTVVLTGITIVVATVLWAGQLVTSGPQLVMVCNWVE
jgi:hypothetical protein